MVKREIHPTRDNRLTKDQIAKIKRNARLEYGLTARSRNEELYRYLGTHHPATAMIRMIALYNRKAREEQAEHEREMMVRADIRSRERRERARLQRLKPMIKLEDLKDFVLKWLNGSGKFFTITIKSTKANIQHTFVFNGINHFNSWFNQLKEREIGSDGNMIEGDDLKNLFKGLIIIENISGLMGGCNKHKAGNKKMSSLFYKYELFNPVSRENNCFFHCLRHMSDIDIDIKQLRKSNNIPTNARVEISQAYKIMRDLGLDYQIIDYNTKNELNENIKYIVFKENHYYVLTKFTPKDRVNKKSRRGIMVFDIETRPTNEFIMIGNNKSYLLKDVICNVYYNQCSSKILNEKRFVTDKDKSSVRKFLDFLNDESIENRTYHVLAHNGGNFDFYFLMNQFEKLELTDSKPQMRGITVIGLNYRGNLFKDTCCFLTNSLSNLSKDYKVEHGKITDMELHGKKITSSQLCFYRPELSFDEFLDLQNTDKEFWELYDKYCMYDCIALYEIWAKFSECVNHLLATIIPANGKTAILLAKCPLLSSNTIGSHSKKILVEINKIYRKEGKKSIPVNNYYKKQLDMFMLETADKEGDGCLLTPENKYDFICHFKRGGISECCKMGLHLTGVAGIDLCSQYSSAVIHGRCPVGNSCWVETYDKTKFGFYLINNIVFDTEYLFKPVAKSVKNKALDWSTNDFDELYIDSYMIKYLVENHGLVSFDVVKGLVSDQDLLMDKLFGKYVNTFFSEKQKQDKFKNENSPEYNPALRGTIKLYLNSLTGKLVEDPAIHYSLKFDDEGTRQLNGVGVKKEYNEDERNDWLVAGVMVYSYSKRILFEYIKCLPDKSNSVIHVETDGIYFSMSDMEQFKINLNNYDGDYPCKLGKEMGNLEIEHETEVGSEAYFLGKKFYHFQDKGEDIFRVKGMNKYTITPDGTKEQLVDKQLYVDYYNGKKVTKNRSMMKKHMWGDKIVISGHYADITLNPEGKVFNLYK